MRRVIRLARTTPTAIAILREKSVLSLKKWNKSKSIMMVKTTINRYLIGVAPTLNAWCLQDGTMCGETSPVSPLELQPSMVLQITALR